MLIKIILHIFKHKLNFRHGKIILTFLAITIIIIHIKNQQIIFIIIIIILSTVKKQINHNNNYKIMIINKFSIFHHLFKLQAPNKHFL